MRYSPAYLAHNVERRNVFDVLDSIVYAVARWERVRSRIFRLDSYLWAREIESKITGFRADSVFRSKNRDRSIQAIHHLCVFHVETKIALILLEQTSIDFAQTAEQTSIDFYEADRIRTERAYCRRTLGRVRAVIERAEARELSEACDFYGLPGLDVELWRAFRGGVELTLEEREKKGRDRWNSGRR